MALITGVVLPNNGDRIKVENYNDPINKILAQVNGNLDDSNISGINGSKIAAGSVPYAALTTAAQTALAQGWNTLSSTPNTVAANGNRSYTLTFNGVDLTGTLNPGYRLRSTRTVSSPTQSTSLNGSNQYWVKTAPNKLTFTDDFVVSAWVKLTSYSNSIIASRYNGTNGWYLQCNALGQIVLVGTNAAAGNFSQVTSAQAVPLNKWIHVTAQLDMSAFTASVTTSYIMMDGVDVVATVSRGGTNPTALVQAGNLEIGSYNGGTLPFPGKVAQVAIFNNKLTQSTVQGYISQGLTGSETNLATAISFNGVTTDLNTTTPNDLSAGAGAPTATSADSPFGMQANGAISSTTDYGIVQSVSFSTNTTLVVQVPEGNTLPTTGGISAMAYSSVKAPYGFTVQKEKWTIVAQSFVPSVTSLPAANTWYNNGGKLSVPIGNWEMYYGGSIKKLHNATNDFTVSGTLSAAPNSSDSPEVNFGGNTSTFSGTIIMGSVTAYVTFSRTNTAQTIMYFNTQCSGAVTSIELNGITSATIIRATNALL